MKVVAIMRPRDYLKETEELFSSAGFDVISVPFLRIEEKKLTDLNDFQFEYVIITSQTAAKIILRNPDLFKRIKEAKIISIGSSTARILAEAGLRSLVPSKYDSTTLYNEFKNELSGKRVIIFRSDRGDPVLLRLSEIADVWEYTLYKIQFEHGDLQIDFLKKLVNGEIDFIVFSSRMMVQSFFQLAEKLDIVEEVMRVLKDIKVVAIGPPTKQELKKYGVNALMPEEYTFKGVLELIRQL